MQVLKLARAFGHAVRRIAANVEGAVILWGRKATSHVFELAGAASIGYGTWLIYQPAGYMVAGVLAIGYAFLLDSSTKP